jgi:hypothetical protein
MDKRLKLVICASLVVMLVAAYAVISVQAGNPAQNSPVSSTRAEQPDTVLPNRTLAKTYMSYDNGLVAVAAGFQPIDSPTTVLCPGTSGTCTIVAEENLQLSGTTAGNRWAICLFVDGTQASQPNCPFLGFVTSDGSYAANSFSQAFSGLSFGSHTVQSFVYTDSGANRSIYSIHYRVYRP